MDRSIETPPSAPSRRRQPPALLLALALVGCDPAGAIGGERAPATPTEASCGAATTTASPTTREREEDALERWARLAVSGSAGEREAAIAELRRAGPRGLEAFTRRHAEALVVAQDVEEAAGAASGPSPAIAIPREIGLGGALLGALGLGGAGRPTPRADDEAARLDAAIDAICRQHGCRHTQLYWFTDLEAAKAEARASGRPILSLRLLGDLGEALSCANSRLFRTILYPAIASTLRERFVLHWSSERPAPVITVDFGDGRRLTRTITGNSVHFVLDADGRPVDAIPGLVPPPVFERLSERAAALALRTRGLAEGERTALLREHHQGRLAELEVAWAAEMRAIGEDPSDMSLRTVTSGRPGPARWPAAREAMPLAASKMRIEGPMLGGLGLAEPDLRGPAIWERLGRRHRGEARLAPASLRAMAALEAIDAATIAASEASLAVDGVRNEYELHREIHRWFAAGEVGELTALGRRIYDDLFKTPADDPSLGMAPPAVFAGLPGGGWSATPGAVAGRYGVAAGAHRIGG